MQKLFKWKHRSQDTHQETEANKRPSSSTSSSGHSQVTLQQPRRFGISTLSHPLNPNAKAINLIFVHGLGGSPQVTWSHANGSWLSWLPNWLREEEGLDNVRIATFGYDADYRNVLAAKNGLGITEFAQQLLDGLDLFDDKYPDTITIFVAHSMGGLVVKKAIILAHQNSKYAEMLSRIKAVIFLATPHRGADLAKLLSVLLAITFSRKIFVDDLSSDSRVVQEINNDFLGRTAGLELISYYESRGVQGFGLIVPQTSATMGVLNEKTSPLNGDHIEISKYESNEDDNFRRVAGNIAKIGRKLSTASAVSGSSVGGGSVLPPDPIPNDAFGELLRQALAASQPIAAIIAVMKLCVEQARQQGESSKGIEIQVFVYKYLKLNRGDDEPGIFKIANEIAEDLKEEHPGLAVPYLKESHAIAAKYQGEETFVPAVLASHIVSALLRSESDDSEETMYYYHIAQRFQDRVAKSPGQRKNVLGPGQAIAICRYLIERRLYSRNEEIMKCLHTAWNSEDKGSEHAEEVMLLFAEDFAGRAWLDNHTDVAIDIANFVIDTCIAEGKETWDVCARCQSIITRIGSGEVLFDPLPSERKRKFAN